MAKEKMDPKKWLYNPWLYILLGAVVFIVAWSVSAAGVKKDELKANDVEQTEDVMLEPTVHPLTGKPFDQYLERRGEFVTKIAEGQDKLFTVKDAVVPCTPDMDGPCGFDLEIWGPLDWQSKPEGNHTFYFAEDGQNGKIFYGPFEDHLLRIMDEARLWN